MRYTVSTKTKIYFWIAVICFFGGVLSWVPYVIFDIQKPYGMLTFILSPIGLVFGALANNKLVAWGNLFMLVSFIPVGIFVYFKLGYLP